MIKQQRQIRILSVLRREGAVDLGALSRIMPEVSRVTLRRDLAELAEAGALKRRHGGAVLPDAEAVSGRVARLVPPSPIEALARADAVILPPVSGRGGAALRRQIVRRGLPFLAESAAQEGGAYLGPQNREAGRALGALAAEAAAGPVVALSICQPDLGNTRARSEGFEEGLRAGTNGACETLSVNGQGAYRTALRVALDALRARPDVTVAFAVNDHSAEAAIEAAGRLGMTLAVYAVGGESPALVGRLAEGGPLKAVAALFPEVVGRIGIDRVAAALAGAPLPEDPTPHVILTPETLETHYARTGGDWALRPGRLDAYAGAPAGLDLKGRTVAFMPHYPAHDWYRAMIAAMRERAALYGMALEVVPPHQGIIAERTRLRGAIAAQAAAAVRAGQTVIVGHGEAGRLVAAELRRRAFEDQGALAGTTVITNALDVLHRLAGAPGLRTLLTAGELQAADGCLVGPQLDALFERMRADVALLGADGVTSEFGPSSVDERLALAAARCARAARRVVVMAEHLAVGTDATHRILRPDAWHVLMTDDGTPPGERQRLRSAGIEVLVAGDPLAPAGVPGDEETDARPEAGAPQETTPGRNP